ncbi:MAG: SDR family oxidoreductase [Bacteroidaceae bacterium]|nr:SDR family oxidoreductase [Bacteroidaceae bacterium]
MKKLEGRTALITGCNRGLGRAIMDAFVREGASVVACTRKQTDGQEAYYAECEEKYGVKIYPLYFDLADEDAIKAAMKQLFAMKLTIDILVNNAGILNTDGLLRLSMEKAHAVMQVNYFAPILITQYVVKLMLRSKHASIINMASIAALLPTVGNTVYGASKAALISMTTCWAKELASAKIRVNAIAPGYMDTEMTESVDKTVMDSLVADTALKRLGKADEVAKTAVFLASDDSSYIDGEIIKVTGGYRI